MATRNGYAALVKKRAEGKGKRRKLDDYETPEDKTAYLADFIKLRGPILECACGSGRMTRALSKAHGVRVYGSDVKTGSNFFDRKATWAGDIVTNPPYRDGMADAFPRHALRIADGKVAMLMETKFLHGDKRAASLFAEHKPELVIVIPERIYFFVGGKPIPSQFFNHIWIVWPERKKRERGGYETRMVWAHAGPGF